MENPMMTEHFEPVRTAAGKATIVSSGGTAHRIPVFHYMSEWEGRSHE